MSYLSRVYRQRNAHTHDDLQQQPFFSKQNDINKSGQNSGFFQAKLAIGKPGDKYEQEADAVANAVVSRQAGNAPVIQQKKISGLQRASDPEEKLSTNDARMEKDKEIQEKPIQRAVTEPEKKKKEGVQKMDDPEKDKKKGIQKKDDPEKKKKEGIQKMDDPEKDKKKGIQKKGEPVKEDEDKKKAGAVQTKPEGNATAASPQVSSRIENSSGKGTLLPPKTLHEMSSSFGVDFSNVHIHNDSEAAAMNKELQAQAFTHGSDIYFNDGKYNPDTESGKLLLAHELTHVIQQGEGQNVKADGGSKSNYVTQHPSLSTILRQGLLSPSQEQSAIFFNNGLFDLRSRMIIQIITGTTVDGVIGTQTVEAIATFQNNNGLTPDGKVGENTLNAMVADRVTAGSQEHAIQLVVDFFNLDLSQTLSVAFDPTILLANTTFEPGGIRVVRVGNIAFLTAGILRTVIASQLALPAPAVPAAGPRPDHLNGAQEIAASNFNLAKFNDLRSVMAIQGLVGSAPDGKFGSDTAERIAEFQQTNGLTADGKVGEQTLRVMVQQLNVANQQNAAIRLIIDFFNLSEHNALLDIAFDPTLLTANATTGGDIPGPSEIRIGPSAFAQGFEGLVHTIAHELDHVRQRREGIPNQDEREFLGESVEILSIGTPEENDAGFFDDAGRAIFHWNRLPAADQRRLFNRFTLVRNKVRQRFNAASPADQVTNLPTLNAYNAVVRP